MLGRIVFSCLARRFSSSGSGNYDKKNTEYLNFRKYNEVMLISINRPEKRNAVNECTVKALKRTIEYFENDDSFKAAVIAGEGGNFCAGYDLEELAEEENVPEHFLYNNLTECYVRKPLVAAINGYAVGFGFDLALWCDLRIMDETAIFGCLGRRYGMSMSEAGIYRLQAMVGLSKAIDIIMTCKPVKSKEALQFGLANRVVSCGTAIGQALSVADQITKFPQAALLTDRAILYKHVFSKLRLKNSVINEDSVQFREQALKDSKRGAKLFTSGAGRKGQLISKQLWDNV